MNNANEEQAAGNMNTEKGKHTHKHRINKKQAEEEQPATRQTEVEHIKEEIPDDESSSKPPSPEAEDPPEFLSQPPALTPLQLHPGSQLITSPNVTSDNIPFTNFPMQKPTVSGGGNGGGGGMLDVPVLTDSEGEYGFSVKVEEKERTMKSPMWLMSHVTKKLYTNINKSVPFEVHLSQPPTDGNQLYVKAIPVFSSPQFLRTNVTRCPNHAAPADPTNHDFPYPEYVVRADHPSAQYVKGGSGRLAVVVPLDPLQDEPHYTPVLLRFMCLGSCVGGINRRPIAIVITLENSQGEVLGRKVIDVRVCACPTRDIKTDEQATKGTKRKANPGQEKPSLQRKKPKMIEPKMETADDDQCFNIKVRGKPLYNFLQGVKEMYYTSHPEYAVRYPDPLQSQISKFGNKSEGKDWKRQECMEEINNCGWESASPTYELDDLQKDPLDITDKNSTPMSLAPQVKMVWVDSDVNKRESPTDNGELKTQSQLETELVMPSSPKVSTTKSPVSIQSTVVLSRHIPVMQISSYKPPIRRVASEPKFPKNRQPITLRLPRTSINQSQGMEVRTSPVKVERELSPVREGSVSPASKELLAANVLSGRFFQEEI